MLPGSEIRARENQKRLSGTMPRMRYVDSALTYGSALIPLRCVIKRKQKAGPHAFSAQKEMITMRNFKQWVPWALLFVLAISVSLTFGQSALSQQPASRSAGRYVIYYHPTNFNQAFLLDTSTGSVWELASDSYKSIGPDSQVKDIQFRTFQRLGVEGIYQSALDKVQEMERQEDLSRARKLAEPVEVNPLTPPETPK
jgi:hypothetical protein